MRFQTTDLSNTDHLEHFLGMETESWIEIVPAEKFARPMCNVPFGDTLKTRRIERENLPTSLITFDVESTTKSIQS
jgi:hypothetical protein